MIDWPGTISSTIFLSGCTLRCPYCHNPELIQVHGDSGRWEEALSHLDSRRGWIDSVVVSGGEPTADPGLLPLLESLAARGLKVKLDTNGMAPSVLEDVVASGLVHYIALDVKTVPGRYGALGAPDSPERILRSIEIVRSSSISHEFRTTVYPPLISPEELPSLAALLAGGELFALQQFRPGQTLSIEAGHIKPASHSALLRAAEQCTRHLPTTTRGV